MLIKIVYHVSNNVRPLKPFLFPDASASWKQQMTLTQQVSAEECLTIANITLSPPHASPSLVINWS